ncbi:SLOG family protein [Streptomyces swartbergensis]|uniref:SLOG family protein n=1 Tax=Streptomyces swartbergensis TaxID=487165 RepID=UPI000D1C4EE1|nr:SLOG family protein [Streptomyces swartbergensis]
MKPYRVLVTGSRDWEDVRTLRRALNDVLAQLPSPAVPVIVVHGDCPNGADRQASAWVRDTQRGPLFVVAEEKHPANWQINGKRAGFIRNAHMINLGADLCLAVIRNGSRGASHTAALAEQAGIPVRRWTA